MLWGAAPNPAGGLLSEKAPSTPKNFGWRKTAFFAVMIKGHTTRLFFTESVRKACFALLTTYLAPNGVWGRSQFLGVLGGFFQKSP